VAAYADSSSRKGNLAAFCKDFWLREKEMAEVQLLRRQLHSIVQSNAEANKTSAMFKETVPLPSDKEIQLLKQLVAAGFIDQVVIRSDKLPSSSSGTGFERKPRRAIEVAYRTLLPSTKEIPITATPVEREIAQSVFVHPSSVLARLSPGEMPEYLVYSHLSRAPPPITWGEGTAKVKVPKTRFHPLTPIAPKTLAALAEDTPLLQIGKPVGNIEELPRDSKGVQRRQCWVGVGLKVPAGNNGSAGSTAAEWPLWQWKVIQRRSGRDWEIERVIVR
jgi:ATP-dependent RNA helicase DHX37/DHR1